MTEAEERKAADRVADMLEHNLYVGCRVQRVVTGRVGVVTEITATGVVVTFNQGLKSYESPFEMHLVVDLLKRI